MSPGTVTSYDGRSADYHLIYGDDWTAVHRQGAALAQLIDRLAPGARTVLDCSCGIGTQAIGLAREGYRVTGSDVSETALQRARREAPRLAAEVAFAPADFRDLSTLGGGFEVVLSADDAVPHMLTLDAVRAALRGMHEAEGWSGAEHRGRYRAVTAAELAAAAASVGFETVRRHSAAAVGFHQLVMNARRATG